MSDYKRLTAHKLTSFYDWERKNLKPEQSAEIYDRLAELEDKIENGTLVELNKPFYSNQLNAWCIFLREGDYIKTLCLTKEQAEEYQKKSQEEQEYELSIFI